jgi:hypothetical protein
MGFMRTGLAGFVGTALLVTTASPALAGGYGGISVGSGYGGVSYGLGLGSSWGGGRGWGRRHRHHDRVDTGDVIGAIAVIGVIAAIASSASKKNRDRSDRADRDDYPAKREDRSEDRRSSSDKRISSEDDAANACADAAEERGGDGARVRDITDVRKAGDGWDVDGKITQRSSWRDRDGQAKNFSCRVRFGSVEDVRIEGDKVALLDN